MLGEIGVALACKAHWALHIELAQCDTPFSMGSYSVDKTTIQIFTRFVFCVNLYCMIFKKKVQVTK